MSAATTDSWTDKRTGEKREKTEWHRVVIFSEGLANVADNYLRKGSKVYFEGKLQTRSWEDQQRQKRYSTEMVLQGFDSKLIMLGDPKGGRDGGSYQQERGSEPKAGAGEPCADDAPF